MVRTGRAVVYVAAAPSFFRGVGGTGKAKSRDRHSEGNGGMNGVGAQWVDVGLARAGTRLPGS